MTKAELEMENYRLRQEVERLRRIERKWGAFVEALRGVIRDEIDEHVRDDD